MLSFPQPCSHNTTCLQQLFVAFGVACCVSKTPYLPCGDCWLFWESQSKWAVVLLDILTIPFNCCVGSCSNWAFDVSVARKEGERMKQEDTGFILFYFISFPVNHLLFQWNCASSPPLFPAEQVKNCTQVFSSVPTGIFSRLEQALEPGREGWWCWDGDQSLGTKDRIRKLQDPALTLLQESPFCFLP